jgi:steroid 5-alpha reductase family enzyme
MESVYALLGTNLLLVMTLMTGLWLISIVLKDVSFIDSFWAYGMVIVAATSYGLADGVPQRQQLLLVLTAIWGLRLGTYLFLRWRREGADRRYVALLSKAPGNPHVFSLTKVFLLQGVLLWLVTLPVQLGQLAQAPAVLGPLAYAGAALALVGIAFESIGDWQLARFKADPANAGQVMDRGLWRYTRHPNYFGDACVWWGLYLIAAETALGRWTIISPLFLTFILIKWSGAALLERRLKRSRPGYEDYVARTSGFIPWPPKKSGRD